VPAVPNLRFQIHDTTSDLDHLVCKISREIFLSAVWTI